MSTHLDSRAGKHDIGVTFWYASCEGCATPVVESASLLQMGKIICGNVHTGAHFQTGHYVPVREHCQVGEHIWTDLRSAVDDHVLRGSFDNFASHCSIPSHTVIGSGVFVGPRIVLANDKHPLKIRGTGHPEGPILRENKLPALTA